MPNENRRVLVTGATGFVGRHLCLHLLSQGYHVTAIGRKETYDISHENLVYFCVDHIDANTNWHEFLYDVSVVVHLAARVHHLQDKGMSALPLYQEINVKGTQQLAKAAVKAGVKRFVYISTIKVIAEKTIDMPLRAEDQPRPQDAYSLSKLQAEQILQEESKRSGMEWVIIRPPLVYGAFVKGNFRRLLRLAKLPLPLPLGALRNRRSLVSINNLISFIECCIHHPNAHREVFLVSDNQDLSTSGLIKLMRRCLGKRSGLFYFPTGLLKLFGFLTGKRGEVARVVESLQLNIEKSMRLLSWRPPFTVEESIQALLTEEEHYTGQNGKNMKLIVSLPTPSL
ncbi:MAG: NAD-dependent epimerase/dehydratase family protein [Gammaproteobacteria bacterium]|jgi:nucleoside-diphosphate-sugar epimerase|nr:NAD-dependent epimerase/dehydratase family protein [Gammaproteobacteria bacterium]